MSDPIIRIGAPVAAPLDPIAGAAAGGPPPAVAFSTVLEDLERLGSASSTPMAATPEAIPVAMQVADNLFAELMHARQQIETAYGSLRPGASE